MAKKKDTPASSTYKHPQESVQRPDVGVEAEFQSKKPPKTYRYDSSLAPELCWDENGERPFAEWLLGQIAEASEVDVAKLSNKLTLEAEQAAKNIAQTQKMMDALAASGPKQAYDALARFKDNSWKALNSYAHAGIHPLVRHADGYPEPLALGVLRNSNGLGLMAGMQAAVLAGAQPLQKDVLALGAKHPNCMPSPL